MGLQRQPTLESGLSSLELEDKAPEAGTPSAATDNASAPSSARDRAVEGTLPSEDVEMVEDHGALLP